jgi:hypothetical protein
MGILLNECGSLIGMVVFLPGLLAQVEMRIEQTLFILKTVLMRFLYIFCLFFVIQGLVAQGPIDGYLKGKGNVDIAVSFSRNTAKTFLGADNQVYNEAFKGSLVSVFAEYGLTNQLDIVATLPYTFTSEQSGLQDGSLHLKFRPFQFKPKQGGAFHIITAAGISGPLSQYRPLAAGAIGQRAVIFQPKLVLQWETAIGPFFNLTCGYHLRFDELKETDIRAIQVLRPDYSPSSPKDYTSLLFKVGLPAQHYYLDAWVERQITNGGSNYAPMVPDLPQAYGVTYTQIGGTAYYSDSGKNGVYLSSGYLLHGRNVSKIFRITLGVVIKL